jgi:phage anti-repressor protein
MELNEIITAAAEKMVRDQLGLVEYHADKQVEKEIQEMIISTAKEIALSKKNEILNIVLDYFKKCEMQVDSRYSNLTVRFVNKDSEQA